MLQRLRARSDSTRRGRKAVCNNASAAASRQHGFGPSMRKHLIAGVKWTRRASASMRAQVLVEGAAKVRPGAVLSIRCEGVSQDHGGDAHRPQGNGKRQAHIVTASHRQAPSCTIAVAMPSAHVVTAHRPAPLVARGISRSGWHHGAACAAVPGPALDCKEPLPAQAAHDPDALQDALIAAQAVAADRPGFPCASRVCAAWWTCPTPGPSQPTARQRRAGVVPAELRPRSGAARSTGELLGTVHRACLHQPAGPPERPAPVSHSGGRMHRADQPVTANGTRSWSALPAALMEGRGLNSLDLKPGAGHLTASGWRRYTAPARFRHSLIGPHSPC